MEITLTDAILHLYPNEEFVIVGGTIAGLEFVNSPNLAKPTQKQVNDAIADLNQMQQTAIQTKANAKAALLARLGMTAEEAALLLS